MIRSRFLNLAEKLQENRIDHALVCSLASLRYFAGYTAEIETGPSPFSTLMGALLMERGERPQLFLADTEPVDALYDEVTINTFPTYTIDRPIESILHLGRHLERLLKRLPQSVIGVETEEFPMALFEHIQREAPQLEFRDISRLLAEIRTVKDEEEIRNIRECCALCDLGQELTQKLAQPGISELELFEEVRRGMEKQEGGRLSLMADMVSGPRTAKIGGPPSQRVVENGNPILCDLVPRHKGYWGDSCNTCVAGAPNQEQQKFFAGISAALAEAIEMIRPGLQACNLDSVVRKRVADLGGGYPHHTGHGVGLTWHEEPRIVPYNAVRLRAGMVIALEPGIYFEGRWGMRLEYVVRVTETGSEMLSRFKHRL